MKPSLRFHEANSSITDTPKLSPSRSANRSNPSSSRRTSAKPSFDSPLSRSSNSSSSSTNINARSVLYLKRNHVEFEAPNTRVSVFFDECNSDIINLISLDDSSQTEVSFQSTEDKSFKAKFIIPVERRIISIKLNPNRTILAYHIDKNIVEFCNVIKISQDDPQNSYDYFDNLKLDQHRYTLSMRTKNSKLLGFIWTSPTQMVLITDISVEYFLIDPNKCRCKHVKSFQSSTNWFVYQPCNQSTFKNGKVKGNKHSRGGFSILMVSTGSIGNCIQPYLFDRSGQILKLERFTVEGNWQGSDKLELFEQSITIAYIYGRIRLLVLQHESLNAKSKGALILVYTVNHETGITSKTHTLDLDVTGKFAINIIDNLVVAHNQPTKSSFIFDIMVESTEKSDCPKHYVNIMSSQSIRDLSTSDCDMYSINWVFFQPNYIIDVKIGLLSTLHLDLSSVQDNIHDDPLLLTFLGMRYNSEPYILTRCRHIVATSLKLATGNSTGGTNLLSEVSASLEILSKLIATCPSLSSTLEVQQNNPPNNLLSVDSATSYDPVKVSISQDDVYREVLAPLGTIDEGPSDIHFVTSTLLELIFVIRKQGKTVDFCIYKQLVDFLVKGKRYYQLVQLVRSEILQDSKQLACLLLSLRDQWQAAAQLGIDMLHRLNCLSDLIGSLNLGGDPTLSQFIESSRIVPSQS